MDRQMSGTEIVKIVAVLFIAFYVFKYACRSYENYSTIRYSANSNAMSAVPAVDTTVGSSTWSTDELNAVEAVEAVPAEPDWVQKFARAENLTVQENMLNVGNHERFYSNELAQRSLNQDLRKLPVVPMIPGVTMWNQTTIHPSVIAQEQNRPSLDD
jgi:hypothetical protein